MHVTHSSSSVSSLNSPSSSDSYSMDFISDEKTSTIVASFHQDFPAPSLHCEGDNENSSITSRLEVDSIQITTTTSIESRFEDICSCTKPKRYNLSSAVYGYSKSQYYDYSDLSNLKEHELALGEDFYFYTNSYMGVSDGVGGWSSYGIDSSRVSRDIMNYCKYFAKEEESKDDIIYYNSRSESLLLDEDVPLNPLEILTRAYEREVETYTNMQLDKPLGSTTACVLHLNQKTAQLSYANIGDSGFMVFRRNGNDELQEVLFVAKDRSRIINGLGKAPFQLSFLPPRLIETKEYFNDKPSDAIHEQNVISLREGDIIVMGSDGLFDNIKTDVMVEYLNEISPPGTPHDVRYLARELAELARNQHRKIDDIVCLCAKVVFE